MMSGVPEPLPRPRAIHHAQAGLGSDGDSTVEDLHHGQHLAVYNLQPQHVQARLG